MHYRLDSFRKIRALTPFTPKTVELIPILGTLPPRGGPVQDPVLTNIGVQGDYPCFLRLSADTSPYTSSWFTILMIVPTSPLCANKIDQFEPQFLPFPAVC